MQRMPQEVSILHDRQADGTNSVAEQYPEVIGTIKIY